MAFFIYFFSGAFLPLKTFMMLNFGGVPGSSGSEDEDATFIFKAFFFFLFTC